MKVLVFGKTGQVGRALQARCPADWHLTALDRATADLTEPSVCIGEIEATDANVIINAAGYTSVDQAESEESLAMAINAEAPGEMARAAAARGLAFIQLSTDYVFDGSGAAPWRPDDVPAPLGAYGRSKYAGERAVADAKGRAFILRTSWVFSAHGQNFVKTMLRLGKARQKLDVVADQVGGPTPAAAIADALFSISRQLVTQPEAGGVYHFAGSPDTSWAGFAREIFRQAGLPVEVTEIAARAYPASAQRPLNSQLDCSALARDFGIERPDWRVALATVLEDLGAHADA